MATSSSLTINVQAGKVKTHFHEVKKGNTMVSDKAQNVYVVQIMYKEEQIDGGTRVRMAGMLFLRTVLSLARN